MNCKNCKTLIDENQKFCSQCGEKIIKENNIQIDVNKNIEVDKKSQPYLIIGILLAFCCSLPFGIAIILLNELKYKPQLREGNQLEADKTKNLMIIIMCVGIFFGTIISGLYIFFEIIAALA